MASRKSMAGLALSHLYVHVPFCDGKCSYCASYSRLYAPDLADAYLASLAREMDMFLGADTSRGPDTIYFGGGTPTVLSERQLAALCESVAGRVQPAVSAEWTVESNPCTLTRGKCAVLREFGVNRVSIGAQSFDDRILNSIGRRHACGDIRACVDIVRESGMENFGLDLIASLPGVDAALWRATIREALRLKPRHVSVYGLAVEPGSALAEQVEAGLAGAPDDVALLKALRSAERLLSAAGYARYEISNYALPGFECRHNLAYWRGEDYLGFGPAASSRSGPARRTNEADIEAYVGALSANRAPPAERETLSPETDAAERFVFAFRAGEGVDPARFRARVPDLVEKWTAVLLRLESDGAVAREGERWFLTARGRELADHVARELLDA